MVAHAYTVAFEGVEARMVEAQCAVTPGMPGFANLGSQRVWKLVNFVKHHKTH